MDVVKEYFKGDTFAKNRGIEIVDVSPGHARVKMPITPDHLNAMGIVHGAAVFAVADFAFAVASNSHKTLAVAISANICFVKAATEGTLFAEAREESRNPKIASYSIRVSDEADETVAIFQGLVYRKKDSLTDFVKDAR